MCQAFAFNSTRAALSLLWCLSVIEASGWLKLTLVEYVHDDRNISLYFRVTISHGKTKNNHTFGPFSQTDGDLDFPSKTNQETDAYTHCFPFAHITAPVHVKIVVETARPTGRFCRLHTLENSLDMTDKDEKEILLEETGEFTRNISIEYRLAKLCDEDSYGPLCVYCKVGDPNDHFTCGEDGEKICQDNWILPERNCSVQRELCKDNVSLCHKGGTCISTAIGYRCLCPPNFKGVTCDQDFDECSEGAFPCVNDGKCINEVGTFKCDCPKNFTGKRCEVDVDECLGEPYPCLNEGHCHNLVGTYECICPRHFTGKRCEEAHTDCNKKEQTNWSAIWCAAIGFVLLTFIILLFGRSPKIRRSRN